MRPPLKRIIWPATVAAALFVSFGTAAGQLDREEQAEVESALSDFNMPHEGRPLGVPQSYDWFTRPVLKKGNDPGTYRAMTGWGHIFWSQHSTHASSVIQLRNMRVYLCAGNPGEWRLVQAGRIYGREFDAEFRHNKSRPAPTFHEDAHDLRISFSRGSSFHFWPRGKRHALSQEKICGFVVTVQARLVTEQPGDPAAGNFLIGLGADYWRDLNTKWDGKSSNPGIALGRLKFVTDQWRWFALNTSSKDATKQLVTGGYVHAASGIHSKDK